MDNCRQRRGDRGEAALDPHLTLYRRTDSSYPIFIVPIVDNDVLTPTFTALGWRSLLIRCPSTVPREDSFPLCSNTVALDLSPLVVLTGISFYREPYYAANSRTAMRDLYQSKFSVFQTSPTSLDLPLIS